MLRTVVYRLPHRRGYGFPADPVLLIRLLRTQAEQAGSRQITGKSSNAPPPAKPTSITTSDGFYRHDQRQRPQPLPDALLFQHICMLL